MVRRFLVPALVAGAVLIPNTAYADDDPPSTGCCFSFSHSPVNVYVCTVKDACVTNGKP